MKMLERAENKRGKIEIVGIEDLVPKDHLLRKIEKAVDFQEIYGMVERYYCADNGRPAVDPVVLVKIVLIQHLFGIRSLRQTVKEIQVNLAYRWFLGLDLTTKPPHFATVSYAFCTRFPSELARQIFAWILDAAVAKKVVVAEEAYIDATQTKASANKKKSRKVLIAETARIYDEQLREEIETDREAHGKKPLKEREKEPETKEITVSNTDPDCGIFRKGEHKVEFAYESHTACDARGFVLGYEVTAGNVHDSVAFDPLYDQITERFPEIKTIAMDKAYKTPWICKRVFDDGRTPSLPYRRPMTKDGFFKKYEYVYDPENDCYHCPANQVLKYSTTNREGYREYKSKAQICANCPMRHKCTESKSCVKVITRHIWEGYLDHAEAFRHTPEGKATYARRKETIERVFADAKEKHAMRYTHLRGLPRVTAWVGLKFAAMNLKKLACWDWRDSISFVFALIDAFPSSHALKFNPRLA
jgi:transposase